MKRIPLTPERIAGFFLVGSFVLLTSFLGLIALRQGWFDRKVEYVAFAEGANDLRPGIKVELRGLPVGRISDLTFAPNGQVKITLTVRQRFAYLVTKGTRARLVRPLFVGEKVIELVPAAGEVTAAESGSILAMAETSDPLAVLKGADFTENLGKISSLLTNLNGIAEQANQKQQLQQTVANIASLTKDLRAALPHYTANAKETSSNVTELTKNLLNISNNITLLMPAITQVAKTAPETSRMMSESLNETRILVKALQKNFFVRGNVSDVREEEEEAKRKPANSNGNSSEIQPPFKSTKP